jgi:large subunit ribosomal protein L29
MKAADLREKTPEDLQELHKSLLRDVFQNRLKNFTNRLDDTSTIGKTKRDLARVVTVLRELEKGIVRAKPVDKGEAAEAPKAKKPKATPKVEAKAVEAPAETKAEKPKKSAKAAASAGAPSAEAAEPAKKKSSSTKAKKEAR